MKRCSECKQTKPLGSFHKSARHPGGVTPRCIPCAIKVAGDWYAKNKERKRAYDERRRREKRELYRLASQRFRMNNPAKKNEDTAIRRAALLKRVPSWVGKGEYAAIYESAARVSVCTGVRHVVDHVIPLRGKYVSGLHVPGNLMVLPESLNLLKGNNHYSSTRDGIK